MHALCRCIFFTHTCVFLRSVIMLMLARVIVQILSAVISFLCCIRNAPLFTDVLWGSRGARIATVSARAQFALLVSQRIVAVRRSRSGLPCAGVTVPNQSQIYKTCQCNSQHGPRISCLPSHDKCICCCLGIWIYSSILEILAGRLIFLFKLCHLFIR